MFEIYDNKVKETPLNDGTHATSGDSIELNYEELELIRGGVLKPKGMQHLHVEIHKTSYSPSSPSSSVGSNATPPGSLSSIPSIPSISSLFTPSPGRTLTPSPSSQANVPQSGRPTKRRRIE